MTAVFKDKIISVIREIPTLKGLSGDELEMIAPLFIEKTFQPGDFIIVEGTQGDSMYIINRGSVLVTSSDRKGDVVTLGTLKDGAFFGELSLFDNLPRSATVTAVRETSIFMITRSDLDKIFSSNPVIANKIYYNTLLEIFSRFRQKISSFTFSQSYLREKSEKLKEINRDLSKAQEIQNFFIKADPGNTEQRGVKYSHMYKPSIAIGGDFINVHSEGSRIYTIIADVQGHGITAALVTGILKSAFVMLVKECGNDPVEFLLRLNNHLYEVIKNLFATCYYSIIDTESKKIIFAKAGHHHPFFWNSSTDTFNNINSLGPGLGIIDDPQYSAVEMTYNPGDKLLFFTDGIVEQRNSDNKMYETGRLSRSFKNAIAEKEPDILNRLFEDLHAFSGDMEYEDDITMLLYEF